MTDQRGADETVGVSGTTAPDVETAADTGGNPVLPGAPQGSGDGQVEEGHLAYDCAAWAGETRRLLRTLLETNSVPHAWQGTTLTVREVDEERVDALIEEVAGTARAALDSDAPKLVYEVSSWSAAMQSQLAEELALADVPYEWDERGDLVVLEADEDQVELLLDELPDPDDATISSDDGVAVHELLDRLFMASDRLARNGEDASGTVELVDTAEVLERLALPFGFEPGQWRTFVGEVQQLRALLEGEASEPTDDGAPDTGDDGHGATEDRIEARSARVRDIVRRYI